jgi:hypothetical protein
MEKNVLRHFEQMLTQTRNNVCILRLLGKVLKSFEVSDEFVLVGRS